MHATYRAASVAILRIRIVQITRQQREKKLFISRYVRRTWLRTWCTMLRYNFIACGRDTAEGLRDPRARATTHNHNNRPYPRPNDGDAFRNDKIPYGLPAKVPDMHDVQSAGKTNVRNSGKCVATTSSDALVSSTRGEQARLLQPRA